MGARNWGGKKCTGTKINAQGLEKMLAADRQGRKKCRAPSPGAILMHETKEQG